MTYITSDPIDMRLHKMEARLAALETTVVAKPECKSLGEIAFNAHHQHTGAKWVYADKDAWNEAAKAVAEAIIERHLSTADSIFSSTTNTIAAIRKEFE